MSVEYDVRPVAEDCTDLLALRRQWFPDADEDFDADFRAQWLYGANVYVSEAYRRHGIGHALMTGLIDFARSRGIVRVVLAPSEMSVPLYESLGFRPAQDLMRLDLSRPEQSTAE